MYALLYVNAGTDSVDLKNGLKNVRLLMTESNHHAVHRILNQIANLYVFETPPLAL